MSAGIIIQARTKSTRLPNKIFADLNGKYTLQRVLENTSQSKISNRIILAMPEYDEEEFKRRLFDKHFYGLVDSRFMSFFGSSDDLVGRYFEAARLHNLDVICRVTCDCPLSNGQIIDEMLIEYMNLNDPNVFMGNNLLVSSNPYPCGCDIEIFSYKMLAETYLHAQSSYEREHVVPFMYRQGTSYKIVGFENRRPHTMVSNRIKDFSLDTEYDYEMLKEMTAHYDAGLTMGKTTTAALNYAIEQTRNISNKTSSGSFR